MQWFRICVLFLNLNKLLQRTPNNVVVQAVAEIRQLESPFNLAICSSSWIVLPSQSHHLSSQHCFEACFHNLLNVVMKVGSNNKMQMKHSSPSSTPWEQHSVNPPSTTVNYSTILHM